MVSQKEYTRYQEQHLKALRSIADMLENLNVNLARIAGTLEAKA